MRVIMYSCVILVNSPFSSNSPKETTLFAPGWCVSDALYFVITSSSRVVPVPFTFSAIGTAPFAFTVLITTPYSFCESVKVTGFLSVIFFKRPLLYVTPAITASCASRLILGSCMPIFAYGVKYTPSAPIFNVVVIGRSSSIAIRRRAYFTTCACVVIPFTSISLIIEFSSIVTGCPFSKRVTV